MGASAKHDGMSDAVRENGRVFGTRFFHIPALRKTGSLGPSVPPHTHTPFLTHSYLPPFLMRL